MDIHWPDILANLAAETWRVAAAMAPSLLLGFLAAGLLSVFISPAWLERHLGGRSHASIAKAALLGVPLPLCSCGVLPVGASLRQHGASRAATAAFLLSTPQTGVDSIFVTWSMLGPVFALFRPLFALLTGLLGGVAVQALVADPPPQSGTAQGMTSGAAAAKEAAAERGVWKKLGRAGRYGLVTLPGDIGRALLVGLALAGILGALVPDDFLQGHLGAGLPAILVMIAVGIPLYVCATASVPVAAGFIAMGASPGAALAFLIAGPATNAAALSTLNRVLGRAATIVFLATIAASALAGGLLLDWLLPKAALLLPQFGRTIHHHGELRWWEHASAVILAGVLARSLWAGRPGRGAAATGGDPGLQRLEFEVRGMNCSHCADSVRRAVMELPGVRDCSVSLAAGRASVGGADLRAEAVIAAVAALGYTAALAADPGG